MWWLQNKIRFANVVGIQMTRFLIKMNHKISQMKELLQGTTPNRLGAQTSAFTLCNRTLCLPSTTFLSMWLRNKICFAVVVGTKKTRFWIKVNHKVSHLKGFHRTTPVESGAQPFTSCTRTFCQPPTSFLLNVVVEKNSFC